MPPRKKALVGSSDQALSSGMERSDASLALNSSEYIGKRVKIVYGKASGETGLVTGRSPGYLVVTLKSGSTLRKRKTHIEIANGELSFGFNGTENSEQDAKEGMENESQDLDGAEPVNPEEWMKKRVIVKGDGMKGKVVYFDKRKKLFTVKLEPSGDKVRVPVTELERYSRLNIDQNSLQKLSERTVEGYRSPEPAAKAEKRTPTTVSRKKARGRRAARRALLKDDDVEITTSASVTYDLPARPGPKKRKRNQNLNVKAKKARKNFIQQYVRLSLEKQLKALPHRPNITAFLRDLRANDGCQDAHVIGVRGERAEDEPLLDGSWLKLPPQELLSTQRCGTCKEEKLFGKSSGCWNKDCPFSLWSRSLSDEERAHDLQGLRQQQKSQVPGDVGLEYASVTKLNGLRAFLETSKSSEEVTELIGFPKDKSENFFPKAEDMKPLTGKFGLYDDMYCNPSKVSSLGVGYLDMKWKSAAKV